MIEAIGGIVLGFLTFLLAEFRRRRKISISPPPPSAEDCKKCYFFQEYKRLTRYRGRDSDTAIIRRVRNRPPWDDSP